MLSKTGYVHCKTASYVWAEDHLGAEKQPLHTRCLMSTCMLSYWWELTCCSQCSLQCLVSRQVPSAAQFGDAPEEVWQDHSSLWADSGAGISVIQAVIAIPDSPTCSQHSSRSAHTNTLLCSSAVHHATYHGCTCHTQQHGHHRQPPHYEAYHHLAMALMQHCPMPWEHHAWWATSRHFWLSPNTS